MAQTKPNRVEAGSINVTGQVIGIIPEVYKGKGLGGKERYNVVVTDRSVTFAMINAAITGPAAKIYANKSTAAILAENKRNFSVEREQLKSLNFKPGHSYIDCCRKLQEIDGELCIVTPKAKYAFYVPFRRTDIAKDVLSRAGLYTPEAAKPGHE
jgi:hypothetical protein